LISTAVGYRYIYTLVLVRGTEKYLLPSSCTHAPYTMNADIAQEMDQARLVREWRRERDRDRENGGGQRSAPAADRDLPGTINPEVFAMVGSIFFFSLPLSSFPSRWLTELPYGYRDALKIYMYHHASCTLPFSQHAPSSGMKSGNVAFTTRPSHPKSSFRLFFYTFPFLFFPR
jgi:hypothetical protein